jgi:hypothetical protein
LWRKRKTEVTVETRQEIVLRGFARRIVARCEQCRGSSLMATPDEIHRLVGASVRKVWEAVESGEVHSRETADGDLLVCLDSLKSRLKVRGLLGPAAGPHSKLEKEP